MREPNEADAHRISGTVVWLVGEFGAERAFRLLMSGALLIFDEYGRMWEKAHGFNVETDDYKVIIKRKRESAPVTGATAPPPAPARADARHTPVYCPDD